jgi:hemerythrin
MGIAWTPALAIGIEDIDDQHRELFARAERFSAAVQAGASEREVGELLDFLHAYAVWHFGLEEAWMRDADFPGYLPHKSEHDRFAADLLALAKEHDRVGPSAFLALRVSAWLGRWLEAHLSGTDAEMGRFLQQRAG